MKLRADLCVIGAGSGGLSVAAGAVQMGASVVLIEGHKMGGDCLNYGCVPSKALIASAKRAHAMRQVGLGVTGAEPVINYGHVMDHVAATIDQIAPHDSRERFEGLGCTVIQAKARFIGPGTVAAGTAIVKARRFVIATGARPLIPAIEGLDDVPFMTNETLFSNREKPRHLLVIGAGPIGLEMAQAHRRLGCEVTVVEAGRALPREDAELAAIALRRLRGEGIHIMEGRGVTRVSGGAGLITLHLQNGHSVQGSHLLVASGRRASIHDLDLGKARVVTQAGLIKVTPGLRSTNRRIYAIGDVASNRQFTHVAGYHAGVVIRSALLGLPARARTDHLPAATYIDPEIASVGLTEAQARDRFGDDIQVLRVRPDATDRARAGNEGEGLVKVIVFRGRILGAGIVAPDAGEMIAPWAIAVANKQKLNTLAAAVLPYPTRSEVHKRAASAYFSPKLFENPMLKRIVKVIQRLVP